jgi:hypothetical protein
MVRRSEKKVIVSGRAPIVSVVLGLCFSVAIAYNALGRQSARHPAPIPGFWFEEILDERAQEETDGLGLRRRDREAEPIGTGQQTALQALVSSLQSELATLNFYGGTVDGLLGPQTEAAISRYQTEHQLEVNGKASAELLEHIQYNRRIHEALRESSASAADPQRDRITLIQTGLAELGYRPGPIDGVIGEQTRTAIMQFESDRRLSVTGEITEDLIRELRNVTGLSTLGGQVG